MSSSPERFSRREFLRRAGEAGRNASAFYIASNLEPYLHFLETKEQEPDQFLYGFTTEPVLARLEPSKDGKTFKYFNTYQKGALLRYLPAGENEGIAWAKIAHDKRPAPRSYRAISHAEIYVPLDLIKPLTPEMLNPINPNIDPNLKRIEISLKEQKLVAYEGNIPVLETLVSTGISSYPTRKGVHRIFTVRLARRMAGDGWDLPGVPFVMYFHWNGQAIHGTYWHENFGQPMSHGCVNLPTEKASWLFRWVRPQMENPFSCDELRLTPQDEALETATKVIIF